MCHPHLQKSNYAVRRWHWCIHQTWFCFRLRLDTTWVSTLEIRSGIEATTTVPSAVGVMVVDTTRFSLLTLLQTDLLASCPLCSVRLCAEHLQWTTRSATDSVSYIKIYVCSACRFETWMKAMKIMAVKYKKLERRYNIQLRCSRKRLFLCECLIKVNLNPIEYFSHLPSYNPKVTDGLSIHSNWWQLYICLYHSALLWAGCCFFAEIIFVSCWDSSLPSLHSLERNILFDCKICTTICSEILMNRFVHIVESHGIRLCFISCCRKLRLRI